MAVTKGVGVVFNCGAITFTAGITSSSSVANLCQSIRLTRSADNVKIKDSGGAVKAMVLSGFMKQLAINIVPHGGSSLAAGIVSMDTHMSSGGAVNTLVGAKVTVVDAGGTLCDGDWCCTNAVQGRTVDGVATVDIELEQSDEGNDLATTIA